MASPRGQQTDEERKAMQRAMSMEVLEVLETEKHLKTMKVTNLIVKRPCLGIAIILGVSLLTTILTFKFAPFNIVVGGDVFSVRSHSTAIHYQGMIVGIEETLFSGSQAVDTTQEPQSEPGSGLVLIFKKPAGEDVFVAESLEKIFEIENDILSTEGIDKFCLINPLLGECARPLSVTSFIYPLPGVQLPIKQTLVMMQNTSAATMEQFVGPEFTLENPKSSITKSTILFGFPLEGFSSADDRSDEQTALLTEFLDTVLRDKLEALDAPDMEVLFFSGELLSIEFDDLVAQDSAFAIISVLFVFLYMIFHTQSLFVAGLGMLHIILAIPMGYFMFRVVYQQEYFNFLNFLTLFIILGVGADDVFIFLDAWKQSSVQPSAISCSLETRMAWTYSRACKAMLITSFTTATAFFANAVSEIAPIRLFGFFSGTVVVLNYLYVISIFPCTVMIYHLYFQEKSYLELIRCQCSRNKSVPYLAGVDVVNLVDDAEFLENTGLDLSRVESWKQRSLVFHDDKKGNANGSAEGTTAKRTSDAEEQQEEGSDGSSSSMDAKEYEPPSREHSRRDLPPESMAGHGRTTNAGSEDLGSAASPTSPAPTATGTAFVRSKDAVEEEEEADYEHLRRLERFFHFTFTEFVWKVRYVIIFVFTALLITAIVIGSRIKPTEDTARFLPDDHPVQKKIDALNEFKQPLVAVTINVIWGIADIDRSGTDPNKDGDFGTPLWDETFDLAPPASQEHFLAACESAREQPSTRFEEVLCPLEDFGLFEVSQGRPFPVPEADFLVRLRNFTEINPFRYEKGNLADGSGANLRGRELIRFDKETGELRMVGIVLNTTMSTTDSAVTVGPVYDEWEAWIEEQNEKAPAGMKNGFQATRKWIQMQTELALVSAAFIGFAISLSIAYVVLVITTRSLYLSLLAITAIIFVVASILMMMVILGWSLGIIETVCMTILVGLSVDYIVHMAHSVNESHAATRKDRAREALTYMGISVFSAVATTLGSSLVLFMTQILFFVKFGQFIFMTVVLSAASAFLFFIALVMVIGPPLPCFDKSRQKVAPSGDLP